jgi:hypothetical protein
MNLLELLNQAEKASSIAMDLRGRNPSAYLAVVSNNDDPEGKRRIKVVNPANPSLETYWLRRLSSTVKIDEPMPRVGQTVIVFSIDGVDLNGFYLPCVNDVNPPFDKASPQNDYRFDIEGKHQLNIAGTSDTTVGGKFTLDVGGIIDIDGGAAVTVDGNSIALRAGGSTIAISSTGQVSITSSGTFTINANVAITGSASINGKAIAVIGAVDSRGDALVTSGQ